MNLEEVEENAADDNLFGLDLEDEVEIAKKPVVSMDNIGKKQFNFKREKPEVISSDAPITPRRRGRPPKSTNAKTSTQAEAWVIVTFEIVLGLGTGILATNLKDAKYKMTKAEAESAAKGIVYVLYQYKQFREFAAMVNPKSNYYIVAKAFWPYISRVFMKEVIDNVVSGFTLSKSAGRKSGQSEQSNRQSNIQHDATNGTVTNEQSSHIPTSRVIDWRDVG